MLIKNIKTIKKAVIYMFVLKHKMMNTCDRRNNGKFNIIINITI